MSRTILLTGATDGIGYETAQRLAAEGHTLLVHGRSKEKLRHLEASLPKGGAVTSYQADLSRLNEVRKFADDVLKAHPVLDVLINNAGVYKTPHPMTPEGHDVRFIVNTVAPYLLTKRLLPALGAAGRVVNLSSAAQAPVDLDALLGGRPLGDGAAYAQSKLAITMWSFDLAGTLPDGPVVVAVNPGSLLGSKMVKEAYGTSGKDLAIGADILVRAAVSDEFAQASGKYFDNDSRRFGDAHPDALDLPKREALMHTMEALIQ